MAFGDVCHNRYTETTAHNVKAQLKRIVLSMMATVIADFMVGRIYIERENMLFERDLITFLNRNRVTIQRTHVFTIRSQKTIYIVTVIIIIYDK